MVAIYLFSDQPAAPQVAQGATQVAAQKIAHIAAYGLLATLLALALSVRPSKRDLIVAFSIAALYGVSDEVHQIFSLRGASAVDVAIDAVGALAAVAALHWWFDRRGRSATSTS